MNFGQALEALKEGKKVTREIWSGYWLLSKQGIFQDNSVKPLPESMGISVSFGFLIIAVLANGGGFAPAQPYQQDLLAEDWEIVE